MFNPLRHIRKLFKEPKVDRRALESFKQYAEMAKGTYRRIEEIELIDVVGNTAYFNSVMNRN